MEGTCWSAAILPKPMIPIGHQPILWHVMQYYSQYGHQDFVLCLGYKANAIKDHFLNLNPSAYGDCIISEFGKKVEAIGEGLPDWRIALVDTGIWRNIVRDAAHVAAPAAQRDIRRVRSHKT